MRLTLFCITCLLLCLFTLFSCQTGDKNNNNNNNPGNNTNYEDPQTQGTTYWWNDTVFYEIFVRSFYDSNGDGMGDLKGLTAKLDYLNDGNPQTETDLGITGIWLMPICQSPSYHGYDVVDYQSIENDYGTREDFLELVQQARQRGIKIIVDLVINHTSSDHPWFIASATQDGIHNNWYRWTSNPPSYNGPWGQVVWHYHANGSYYYGVFWSGMPDLNYREPAVYNEIINISRFWLIDMQVDGFRLDAVKYIYENDSQLENLQETYDFWRQYHTDIKAIHPQAVTVGEAWDNTAIVRNYVDGKLDFCFEFDLATALVNAINLPSPSLVIEKMRELKTTYPYHQYGTFLSNHDQDRSLNQLRQDTESAKLAGAVFLTLPGIPFIYYGEEIGMQGVRPDDVNVRRPMQWDSSNNAGFTTGTPWTYISNNYQTINVQNLQANQNSLWHYYRRFISLRNIYHALDQGTYQAIHATSTSVYAFIRQSDNQVIIVIHNFSPYPLDNVAFNIAQTNIPPGYYSLSDLIHPNTSTTLQVNNSGGFSSWTPVNQLEARASYLLLLQQ